MRMKKGYHKRDNSRGQELEPFVKFCVKSELSSPSDSVSPNRTIGIVAMASANDWLNKSFLPPPTLSIILNYVIRVKMMTRDVY